jgi:hypothetical protein
MSKPLEKPDQQNRAAYRLPRYRLIHLLYVVTILAASMATFDTARIVIGIGVCVFWALVFSSPFRPRAFKNAGVKTLLCAGLIFLFVPYGSGARDVANRMRCGNNLKIIGVALHNYQDKYGSLPPAYVADEDGNRMHSWRVLLLPWLSESALYDQYDFAEPWNGSNNSKLLKEMPSVYSCPGAQGGWNTSYVAVVDPTTTWPGQASCKFSEILDGALNTVLVTEIGSRKVPWLQPVDLELTEAIEVLVEGEIAAAGNHYRKEVFYEYYSGRNVVFGDGAVRIIPHGISRRTWSAMLGKNDGVAWKDHDLEPTTVVKRLNVGFCLRLAMFCVVVLFPIPWVWLNPTSNIASASITRAENKGQQEVDSTTE